MEHLEREMRDKGQRAEVKRAAGVCLAVVGSAVLGTTACRWLGS